MILTIDEIMSHEEFMGKSEEDVQRKLDAIEAMIRRYTNNPFQNRKIRFTASAEGQYIEGCHRFLRVGDTVQISEAEANNGLYVISEIIDGERIRIDGDLYQEDHNLVTKIEYPTDVKEGVLNLMKWEVRNRDKVGIKSESLSRHSVTYYDQDSNSEMGYPTSLLGFLKPYMKARFD